MNPEYFHQISDAFLAGAGRGLALSPKDQLLVAGWAQEGIPARVVVDGIEKAFSGDYGGRTHSMAYVVPAVEECIVAWRSKNVGKTPENINESNDIDFGFGRLLASLEQRIESLGPSVISEAIKEACRAVQGIQGTWSLNPSYDVTSALLDIEVALCERILDGLDPDVRMDLERRVEGAVGKMDFNSNAARTQTRGALMRKRLRHAQDLPAFEIDLAGGW